MNANEYVCRESIKHLEAAHASSAPGAIQTTIAELLVVEKLRLDDILAAVRGGAPA